METWLALLTSILTAFSLWIVWKGYLLAKDYLGQHRQKVEFERKRFAAESALKCLIEFDRNVNFCFSDFKIRNLESFQENLKKVNQGSHYFEIMGEEFIRDFQIIQLRFFTQMDLYHHEIYKPHSEMKYYGELLKDSKFAELDRRFDHDVKQLIRYVCQDLTTLNKAQWDDLKDKFPTSLNQSEKPIIQEYDKSGNALKDLFLSYC